MQTKELILEQFPSLSPKMQEAARFIVDHPNEVVIASMRAVAERAGVQPATFVRLAQQLGYSGWPELKAAFTADLGLQSEHYGSRAKNLATRSKKTRLLDELLIAQQENLIATKEKCADMLRPAVNALKSAQNVYVAGFRASFPIAYSLFYGYRLFRNSVLLIDGQSGGLEMQLRAIEKRDVIVVVSFAPYSREAMFVINAVKDTGARIIAITDSEASPLALVADVTLLFSIDSPSFFPSIISGVAMVEAILELLAVEAGEAGVKKLEQAEQQLYAFGVYLHASPGRKTS